MKVLGAVAVVVAGLAGLSSSASAQGYYGGGGYRDGGYERRGYEGRGGGFDEGGYLRCNPDVRRAVRRGQFRSGYHHFRMFGYRERRRLSC